MDRDEKIIRLQLELGKEQVKALDQLLLRQQAEYTAKGLKPGEDPKIDEKFKEQKNSLQDKIRVRNKELQTLLGNGNIYEFEKKLDEYDPYNLGKNRDGTKRPLEPDAESDYFRAFNYGYKLQELAPEIAQVVKDSNITEDDRLKGVKDGIRQRENEKDLGPEKSISPEIWDELNQATKDITQGRGRSPDRSKDKDKDID